MENGGGGYFQFEIEHTMFNNNDLFEVGMYEIGMRTTDVKMLKSPTEICKSKRNRINLL